MAEPSARIANRIQTLSRLLEGYNHSVPFHHYFQQEAASHKQWGSGDRRFYRHASYSWFRLGNACVDMPFEERLSVALYLNPPYLPGILAYLIHTHSEVAWIPITEIPEPLSDRIQKVRMHLPAFDIYDIFPAADHLSKDIDRDSFLASVWEPRPVWLRPGRQSIAQAETMLARKGIAYEWRDNAIAVPNGSDVDDLVRKGLVQVMDLSSQRAAAHIQLAEGMKIWDCCAGAGGKSLYMSAVNDHLELYASDIRNTVLDNLLERFRVMHMTAPFITVADLKQLPETLVFTHSQISAREVQHDFFDSIVLDAPCTGSGTWMRTPEHLRAFHPSGIETAQKKQLQIAANVLPFLKLGGTLYYMTCSAYAAENEEVVAGLVQSHRLTVTFQHLLQDTGADTLFIAALQRRTA